MNKELVENKKNLIKEYLDSVDNSELNTITLLYLSKKFNMSLYYINLIFPDFKEYKLKLLKCRIKQYIDSVDDRELNTLHLKTLANIFNTDVSHIRLKIFPDITKYKRTLLKSRIDNYINNNPFFKYVDLCYHFNLSVHHTYNNTYNIKNKSKHTKENIIEVKEYFIKLVHNHILDLSYHDIMDNVVKQYSLNNINRTYLFSKINFKPLKYYKDYFNKTILELYKSGKTTSEIKNIVKFKYMTDSQIFTCIRNSDYKKYPNVIRNTKNKSASYPIEAIEIIDYGLKNKFSYQKIADMINEKGILTPHNEKFKKYHIQNIIAKLYKLEKTYVKK